MKDEKGASDWNEKWGKKKHGNYRRPERERYKNKNKKIEKKD